jgi:hypothetical protein
MESLYVTFLTLGVLLLLVGIVGQVKAKEIEVGTKNPLARIILGLIGLLFISVSIISSFAPFIPSLIPTASTESTATLPPNPTATITPSSAPSPTVTLSSSQTPSPVPQVNHIPIIYKVVEREESKAGELYLYKDIFFIDASGDAYLVAYELVSASIAGIQVNNDPIQSLPSEQEIGTYITGTWNCKNTGIYTIILKARILDRAGNQSVPVELTFHCH